MSTQGIHHVTAIGGDPQKNVDFYAGILGLRLVKRTVNFDDPGTYHLYYGDELGHPGTIMTFFPWPGARRGRRGNGQVAVTAFAVAEASLGYWLERLIGHGIRHEGPQKRFDEQVITCEDPDGLALELVAHRRYADVPAWQGGPVPAEHAIRGFHGVTLWEEDYEVTVKLLTERLGFLPLAEEGGVFRYRIEGEGPGKVIDIRHAPGFWQGAMGVGTVHHVAFRVPDDEAQLGLREALQALGHNVTPQLDRQYFHSIYFREPGGVLFEIATDPPGFTVDEPAETLGEMLKLPPWLEPERERLQKTLPPLRLPGRELKDEPDFIHRYLPGSISLTLLLLHGTGGNENALLNLGHALAPGANLLSPRGKVLENGMPRFFHRFGEGVLDVEDLKLRTHELAHFCTSAAKRYGFSLEHLVAVGYSNGANIASSLLLLYPGLLKAAVLLRPMVPFMPEEIPDLKGARVFVAAGRRDPLIKPEETERLATLLESAGARVTLHWEDTGHGLSDAELRAARAWLSDLALQ